MTGPALLVLDTDPDDRETLRVALARRYGQEYLILAEASISAATNRLELCRCVVIATGVSYRRLDAPGVAHSIVATQVSRYLLAPDNP